MQLASHPAFFHAPEETLRILGTAIKAGDARFKMEAKILAKHGAGDYVVPEIKDKNKQLEITGFPFDEIVDKKENSKMA